MENSPHELSEIEPLRSSSTFLLELNNDCLSHICDFLDVFNLINVSDTCSRIREIAECKYKKIRKFEWIKTEDCNSVNLRKVISRIGSQITCLTLNGIEKEFEDKDYCTLIHKKCGRVNSLMLKNTNNYVSVIGESNFLPWLRAIKLQCLVIVLSMFDSRFLKIDTLEKLSISSCCLSIPKLQFLLTKNNRIEILSLSQLGNVYAMKMLSNVKMLHTLSIDVSKTNVMQLGMLIEGLRHLRKLKITCIPSYSLKMNLEDMDLNFFLKKLIKEELLESLIVYRMLLNEETIALLTLLKIKSVKLLFSSFIKTIENIPMQLTNTFNYIEHLKLTLRDIKITIGDIFLMVTELPQLEKLNLCYTECLLEENHTLDYIFQALTEILKKQKTRATRLKLTMPITTDNIFYESEILDFISNPQLQLFNPYCKIKKLYY